ncbi:MAG: PHP domain-containing protein [Chloroflexota bacterium]
MAKSLRVEFHSHSIASPDSTMTFDHLIAACRGKQIDKVVITDHNTIAGAEMAHALAPDLIIIGEEVKTTRGEILAAFVCEEVPPGLTPYEAVLRLREQNAFISLSHPFDLSREHWRADEVVELLPFLDAIEVYNSRCLFPGFNHAANKFAQRYDIHGTVGSDAHSIIEIGRSVMILPEFDGPDTLREAIKTADVITRMSSPLVRFYSRYATLSKRY